MKQNQAGFTIIELIVVIVIAIFAVGLFWVQKSDLDANNRDTLRKQSINSIYYYLNDVYYSTHNNSYPASLDADELRGLNPDTLVDPDGRDINDPESDYLYEPTGCQNDRCTGYTLSTLMQKEETFTKSSPGR